MKLPRKTTVTLLLFILGVNYLVRYPRTPHELGLDAFVFHGMTVSLIQNGYAKWIIHPVSYLGLYPLSHPSGSLFALGALSLTSGLPVEGGILLFDYILVAVGLLAAFMMSMEIRSDERLALTVAALFTLSPRFVTGMLWELPTRTLFTTMVPLFIWLLLRWYHTKDYRWIAITVGTLFLMMSAHRLAVLMAVIILAFILTAIVLVVVQTLRTRYASLILGPRFRRVARVVVLFMFFLVSGILILIGGVLASYEQGRVGIGSGMVAQLSNLFVSLARSAGVFVAFVPLGAIAVYQTRAKTFKEPFLLMILLVLIPTLSLRQYTGYYIIPFTAVFIAMGFWFVAGKLRKKELKLALAATLLAATLVSTQVVLDFDLSFEPYVDDQSYTHGLYVLHETQGTVIGNDGLTASQVFMVSGHPYLPVGGATTAFQSPELLIFGFINPEEMRIAQIPLAELTVESDSPFVLLGVNAERDWATMLDRPRDSTSPRIRNTYDPQYLLEVRDANGGYFAYGFRYDSPFITSVHQGSYKVFEISEQSLWYIGGPP